MAKSQKSASSESPAELHERIHREGHRETVESIVVAIVLALLFRAFVAEAFVIPTGSMAPALMGAHKDLECQQCGQPFQVGASIETRKAIQYRTVVASVCPNCRHFNPLDLADEPLHDTFSGDRILVSKFSYALSDPDRWDVIVFKFPGNPKQNYIKRLVGLPEETLRIRYGDVYARPNDSTQFSILRKPHEKLMAMTHHVHDTAYQARSLVAADYPDSWQPWRPGAEQPPVESWQIERDEDRWQARLEPGSEQMEWMRYYHRTPTFEQWDRALNGLSLADVDPYTSQAITDFYAYDAYAHVDSELVYDLPPGHPESMPRGPINAVLNRFRSPPGVFRSDYRSGGSPFQFGVENLGSGQSGLNGLGTHWVGDLLVEAEVQADASEGAVILELVEAAILFRCRIDLGDGTAQLQIIDIDGEKSFAEAGGEATSTPTASTPVRGGATHQLRFANCDDQLYLWVDGNPVSFDQPTHYSMSALRRLIEQHPMTQPDHPYDAAPVAIGAEGSGVTVRHARVLRDKYYIAIDSTSSGLVDYNPLQHNVNDVRRAIAEPRLWADLGDVWESRRTVEFRLEEDQFFPMGDNSPESQDARCWTGRQRRYATFNREALEWADAHYVPREMLVGKALMVFWPHTWNSPVPFTPNFERIGFIR
jgi:signal peptidase I